jgi:hypothetical protein
VGIWARAAAHAALVLHEADDRHGDLRERGSKEEAPPERA